MFQATNWLKIQQKTIFEGIPKINKSSPRQFNLTITTVSFMTPHLLDR